MRLVGDKPLSNGKVGGSTRSRVHDEGQTSPVGDDFSGEQQVDKSVADSSKVSHRADNGGIDLNTAAAPQTGGREPRDIRRPGSWSSTASLPDGDDVDQADPVAHVSCRVQSASQIAGSDSDGKSEAGDSDSAAVLPSGNAVHGRVSDSESAVFNGEKCVSNGENHISNGENCVSNGGNRVFNGEKSISNVDDAVSHCDNTSSRAIVEAESFNSGCSSSVNVWKGSTWRSAGPKQLLAWFQSRIAVGISTEHGSTPLSIVNASINANSSIVNANGMVVGGRHDYGSIHPSSSALTPAQTSSMEDSDTFLQSRPLLQEDWRPVHPSRTGGVSGPSSTSLNGIISGPHHEGVEDGTATASTGFYRHHASTSSSGSLGAAGAGGVGCGGSNGDLLMRSAETIRINIGTPTPPRFPKEKLKTLVAFLWMLLNFILTLTSLAITHERVPDTAPLPDVVLDNIPTADWALSVSEAIIIVMVYSSFLAVILHKHRYIVLRRIFIMMGLLYMMRSVLYFVTTLPKPNPSYPCAPKAGNLTFGLVVRRVLKLMGGFGLSINGQHVYCGDYIYSGHTVALTMAYLVVREYTPRHWWLLHWTSLAASSVGIVMVLFARGHYTVDVLIAYYVTSRIFWIYHTMANNASLKEHGPSNYLTRLWWHSMFRYFEDNVGGPLPRHFQWPLPWPRCLQNKRPERTS